MGAALQTLDFGSHRSLGNNSGGAGGVDDLDDGAIERLNVLSVGVNDVQTVPLESVLDSVPFQVLRWVATAWSAMSADEIWTDAMVTSLSSMKSLTFKP